MKNSTAIQYIWAIGFGIIDGIISHNRWAVLWFDDISGHYMWSQCTEDDLAQNFILYWQSFQSYWRLIICEAVEDVTLDVRIPTGSSAQITAIISREELVHEYARWLLAQCIWGTRVHAERFYGILY